MNLIWTDMKRVIDNGYKFQYETLDSNRYYIFTTINSIAYECILPYTDTSDKTDFDNNYKAGASVCVCDTLGSQLKHLFDDEALASGVYEDSEVIIAHHSQKTFNVENKHATGSLKYKVWGSPDNSDWEEIIAEKTITALSKESVVNNDFWKYVKLAAKGDGAASTIDAFVQVGQ